MSAFTKPVLIRDEKQSTVLERIPLDPNGDKAFSERWLQDILFAHPQCLPVREIAPHIGELIPICTELGMISGGYADILYVTPTGQIVVVETKLWRNTEARRKVVTQILEYANDLALCTYEVLSDRVATATQKEKDYLLSCAKAHGVDEAAFVDGINRSLKKGDFLLLIVGDGIRYGVESMVGFLEDYGNLHFTFGLIEVAAFNLPDGTRLLLPRILAKTENIKRSIYLGKVADMQSDLASVQQQDNDSPVNADALWYQAFWKEYLAELKLDDSRQPPPKPAKSSNVMVMLPPRGGVAWISVYVAQSTKKAGAFLTFIKGFDKADDYYQRLLSQKDEIEKAMGTQLSWVHKGDKIYISCNDVAFSNLNAEDDRKKTIGYLTDMTNRMVNAFRQRMEVIGHELG